MKFTDRNYLQNIQYQSPANLDARIRLHDLFSVNPHGLHTWVLDQALERLPTEVRILEVGAGHGKIWTKNLDRVPVGWQLHLTDLSSGMLTAARHELLSGAETQFSSTCVDAQVLPYRRGAFDAIFAHFMLYHVPDRGRAFTEFARVLKPGGFLFAATLGINHLRMIYDVLERIDPIGPHGGWELPFRLDNGAAELSAEFDAVQQIDYEDHLEVTQVEPLLDYIRSMASRSVLDDLQIAALRTEITEQLENEGVITIGKESGMFIARRRD